MQKMQILILAAGLGKRMGDQQLPKALVSVKDRPIISYLLDSISQANVSPAPVIVIGRQADLVRSTLGSDYTYIFQQEQLGTGHAVMTAKPALLGLAENIMVLYCDMPLLKPESITRLTQAHLGAKTVMTMATVEVDDFESWRSGFYDFGRIERDENNKVRRIVEKKDATKTQLLIKEVNPGYYCFAADWLWQNLEKLENNNAAKEYYLTDLLQLAFDQGQEVATIKIEPQEALGVNTTEQLNLLDSFL